MSQSNYESYVSPLNTRYASKEMQFNFSDKKRFSTWRRLWLYLASCQKALGLNITDEQIKELEQNIETVDIEKAAEEEKKTRHDVMAHVHVLAKQCPSAAPIIHLGATSCDIVDNADLIILKDAFNLLLPKLGKCISLVRDFAFEFKDLPTLSFTHFQPAQLTTVGKRASLWLNDLLISEEAISNIRNGLKFRGIKGTTGTQASFLQLLGDYEKVKKLDELVTKMAGFESKHSVTGQTYSRLIDVSIVTALGIFGSAAHKICTDIRLLSNHQEISEPVESTQIGSSAMAFKTNPMRSERICSLARHLTTLCNNVFGTASVQWLERTLDDSANRRITLPEAFLTADAVLKILQNIFEGICVYPKIIARNIERELPFMATENIIIAVVEHGGDRQECHERIRCLSMEVKKEMRDGNPENTLIEKIRKDSYFEKIVQELPKILDPKTFIGCAPNQVLDFLQKDVDPVIAKYKNVDIPPAILEV